MNFTKMQAAGNDFVIIDNRLKKIKRNYSILAKELCPRKFSVGADGILVVENSNKADFKMLIFNADGSQAEMCGNGARCIAYYCYINKIAQKNMEIETLAGIVKATVKTNKVKLGLPDPKNTKIDFSLKVNNREFDVSYINTGVPHTVVFVSDLDKIDVNTLGKIIRDHKEFLPEGTNVDFVKPKDKYTILIRTYERGVESETYACGTGAVASAIIAGLKNVAESPVQCITSGGEKLTVYFRKSSQDDFVSPVYDVYLEGNAEISFDGTII